MLKRIAVLCALVLLLGGCSLPIPNNKAEKPIETYEDPAKYIHEFRDNMQYQQLSDNEHHAYGQIYTALRDHATTDSTISAR